MSETSNKQTEGYEAIAAENLQEQFSRTETFARENSKLLGGILVAVLVVVSLGMAYKWYMGEQDKTAQNELFPAVFYFEKGEYEKALNGDGVSIGLLATKEQFGGTDAANLSSFYAGVAFYQQEKYDEAIAQLEDYNGSDLLTQAQAYAVIGDAYMQKGDFASAANYYDKAASDNPNEKLTSTYLFKLALAQEKAENYQAALEAYDKIINKYGDVQDKPKAERGKAKMEQLLK